MIPSLIGIFSAGAAAAVVLAQKSAWPWMRVAVFLDALLAFHEASFAFRPAREWIRIDLLVELPLFTLGNLLLAVIAYRRCRGWWVAGLAGSALAAPIWLALGR